MIFAGSLDKLHLVRNAQQDGQPLLQPHHAAALSPENPTLNRPALLLSSVSNNVCIIGLRGYALRQCRVYTAFGGSDDVKRQ
ncbi:hypothetical protein [Pseudosulfitobacter pseudonitzschiae]|uniref:hypothetical protein n=1 Tax=Pseudosulfitobacter pseudonitzschiae TaxID=1402135 RepID=UPI001BB7927E|nr:hypothetical protein [Pseudosulfitobacter pseudonitzschiae]MBM1940192.1 hypothetical protein [Pseudosulfitobacter pseudonitzschiae]MBM2196539.1 hypothetical protein [Pseudosulfitobacter pseudonitzschiae]QTZ25630.1 hypothetical protein JQK83_23785 [Pseudosulfitobacter pseudonitzschiae]UFE73487.1 hypothetical protein LOE24_22465 [Pseudosulfitobacter pseudonitzschiae]UFE87979.1 hypothetical protein LOE29_23445 [Pseudosulfitobacter pseudonitzschiae]